MGAYQAVSFPVQSLHIGCRAGRREVVHYQQNILGAEGQSFERVAAGEFDHLPEQAFYMQGGIEGVIAEGERLAKEG